MQQWYSENANKGTVLSVATYMANTTTITLTELTAIKWWGVRNISAGARDGRCSVACLGHGSLDRDYRPEAQS